MKFYFRRISIILFVSLLWAADDSFNINVTCSYIDIDVLDLLGAPYPGWMPDTLDRDAVYYNDSEEGVVILNAGNVALALAMRVYDTSGDSLAGYIPWSPVDIPDEIDEFALSVMDTTGAYPDTLSTGWEILDSTFSMIIPLLSEGESRYMYMRLHTPPLTSDRRIHDLSIEIEGSIP